MKNNKIASFVGKWIAREKALSVTLCLFLSLSKAYAYITSIGLTS